MAEKLVRITYEIVTPESAEHGEAEERGWIDEEGESMARADYWDDQGSAVENAIHYLRQHGPSLEPSESGRGAAARWYTDYEYSEDFRTGAREARSYHLHGYSEAERRRIQEAIEEKSYLRNAAKRNGKVYGQLGDINPLDHSGGIVYESDHGPVLEWTYGLPEEIDSTDEGVEDVELEVYRVDIEKNVIDDLDWVDWKDVASFIDMPQKELRDHATSDNIMARASVYEAVAGYHGWHELDSYPLQRKYGELDQEWFPGGYVAKTL